MKKRIQHKKKYSTYMVKKIKFYPPFFYSRLDMWLKCMSEKGLHLVDCGLFTFWFEKGAPERREYFSWVTTQEGKYSVDLRHPFFEKQYGKSKKHSKLNSNESKSLNIIEIDLNRIDVENDIGYKELIRDRDKLHAKQYIPVALLLLFAIIFLVVTSIVKM